MHRAFAFASVAVLVAACGEPTFTAPMTLAGQTVSAETLEEGRIVYQRYCRSCHGDEGRGDGPASVGLDPKPRDFTTAEFKFGSVPNGQLPVDEDLKRIVKGGLNGTAMLPWDISDPELEAVIQYIKTFQPVDENGEPKENKWMKKKKTGEPIEVSEDPWKGREAEAIARGKVVYHVKAMCGTCHPSYVTLEEAYEMSKAENAKDGYTPIIRQLRPNPHLPEPKESQAYGVILPPDFTFRVLRSGETLQDIYRSVGAGIGGTAMPKWKGVLPEEDLWAMVHYVKSLVDMRGTPEAQALLEDLQNAAPFTPPPEEPVPTEGATEGAPEGATEPAAQ